MYLKFSFVIDHRLIIYPQNIVKILITQLCDFIILIFVYILLFCAWSMESVSFSFIDDKL